MKRSLTSILFVILLVFTTIFFVSCKGGSTGDGDDDKSVPENVVLPDIELAGDIPLLLRKGVLAPRFAIRRATAVRLP